MAWYVFHSLKFDLTATAQCRIGHNRSASGFFYEELIPKGGGPGGSHKGAAYSNLIFPQPNFGSRFFLGGSQSQKTPPALINKVCSASETSNSGLFLSVRISS